MSTTVVWITGASSGIGAALATAMPHPDAEIVDISRSGGGAVRAHLAADLSDPSSWPLVEADVAARLGGGAVTHAVFVHNAATIDPVGYAGEIDSAAYYRSVTLNAAAPAALGHAFLSGLRLSGFAGSADLVQLSSGAATSVYEGWSAYCAGKAAAEHWVRTVEAEQRRRGTSCRVLAVTPGAVATSMQEVLRATDERDFPRVGKFRQLHAEGGLVDPAAAARALWRLLDTDVAGGATIDLREQW